MKILQRLKAVVTSLNPMALDGEMPGDNYSVRPIGTTLSDAGSPWGNADSDRLETMRVARYMYSYDGLTGGAIDMLIRLAFPVMPRFDTGDRDLDEELRQYVEAWSARADFTRQRSWTEMQASTVRCAMVDGDIGVWIRKSQDGTPACLLVESHRIASDDLYRESEWYDGVKLNGDGVPSLYRIALGDGTRKMNISSTYFRLMRFGDRPSAYRGVSLLRRPSATVRDRKDILHYQKGKAKLNSWLPFFITRYGSAKSMVSFKTPGAPKDGAPEDIGSIMATLRRGQIPVLDKTYDEDVKPWNMSGQDAQFQSFMDSLAREIATGLGTVTEFVWNPSMLANGTTQRTVLDIMSKRFRELQDAYIAQVGNDIVRQVVAHAVQAGHIRVPAGVPLERVFVPASWQRPAELNIDRSKAQQDREDILMGVTTLDQVCATRAGNWKAVRRQTELEVRDLLDRAKDIAGDYGIPVVTAIDMLSFRGPNGIAVTYDEATTADQSKSTVPSPQPDQDND